MRTTTTALFALSVPRQIPAAGVTVYFQLPVGTACSTQLVAPTLPLQAESVVCSAFVSESYRFTM